MFLRINNGKVEEGAEAELEGGKGAVAPAMCRQGGGAKSTFAPPPNVHEKIAENRQFHLKLC